MPLPRQRTKKPKSGKETRGRKKLADHYPEVITVMREFIQAHSAEAQRRRRDSVDHLHSSADGNAEGFTIGDAQDHLFSNVEGVYQHGATAK